MSIIEDTRINSPEGRPDAYSVCLIFNITSAVFRLMNRVAVYPMTHPELIASGLVWRTIQHCFFDLMGRLYRRSAILKAILRDCTISIKLLVTFVDKFMRVGPDGRQSFTLLTNQVEFDIMSNFHECIKKLFTTKILEKLLLEFHISGGRDVRNMKLECSEPTNNDFLTLFST